MSIPFKLIASGLVLTSALAVAAAGQQPRIENGAVTAQAAGSPFAQTFRSLVSSQPDVAWIGYSVPVTEGDRVMCCFDSGNTFVNGMASGSSGCCGACRLENSSGTSMSSRTESTTAAGVVKLESADRMVILYRIAARNMDRVRVFA